MFLALGAELLDCVTPLLLAVACTVLMLVELDTAGWVEVDALMDDERLFDVDEFDEELDEEPLDELVDELALVNCAIWASTEAISASNCAVACVLVELD